MLRFCVENYMRRRDFIALLAGVSSWPFLARAQQKAMPVIGFLSPDSQSVWGPITATFRQGLSETGYVEGHNLTIEYRWAEGHYERLPALAADLVSHKVDLIITGGGTTAALAAKNVTSTIPIVLTNVGDPVGSGLVASLARPATSPASAISTSS
jgi:putative tryptophan/tyrosine transport system substrate-binding protein